MEFVLLLVAVAAWLFLRGRDRDETRSLLAQQQQEIESLRDQIRALQKLSQGVPEAAGPGAQFIGPAAIPIPPTTLRATPVPPVEPSLPPAVLMAEYLARTRALPAEPPPPPPASVPPKPPPPPPSAPEPPTPSLEQTLGANWLNRLGIALLVFGVALYLAYEVTHLGPLGKVLTAFTLAAALLAGGLWLERKPAFRIFARAGIGGGWALAFLTTYAMFFFPATQVLHSQAVDLLLLFAVGLGMVAHSLRYRSQVVTGLAFLLAFSTVTISQVTVFSLLASAVLALGLEIVCVREAWYALEIAGVLAAYGNHFLWLQRTLAPFGGPGHPFPLWGESTAVFLLFWAIFRAGYCLRHPPGDEAEGLSGLAALLNSAGILALMKYQSFHPEYAFRALLALGMVELALAFFMRSRRRPAFAVLATIASVLLVAAIPFRFGGATWPILWVVQGEAFFLCGLVLRERILRWLGLLTHLLVVAQLLTLHADLLFSTSRPGATTIAAAFFLVAAAMWTNAEALSRQEEPNTSPYQTLLLISSFAAALSACLGLLLLVPGWPLTLLWALLALVLLETALRRHSLRLRLQSYAVLLAALLRLAAFNFTGRGPASLTDTRLWAGLGVLNACILLQERLRRASATVPEHERTAVLAATLWSASALVSTLLYVELPERWLAAGWAAFALALAAFSLVRDSHRLRSKALLLVVLAVARALWLNLLPAWDRALTVNWGPDWGRLPFFTAVALLLAGIPIGFRLRARPLADLSKPSPFTAALRRPEQLFFFAALTLLVLWLPADFQHGALTMAASLLGVAVFLGALAAGERSFRLAGLGLLLLGVAKLLLVDVWGLAPTERYLLLIGVGVALLLVSFLYSRFAHRIKQYL